MCEIGLTGSETSPFAPFCEIFVEASFDMQFRAYADNTGFGIQLAFEGRLETKPGYDILEDIVGWTNDEKSISLGLSLRNKKLKACVGFNGSEFCTGKCEVDDDCEDDEACDNAFKVSTNCFRYVSDHLSNN